MRILLDTHIALWAIADSTKLNDDLIQMIQDTDNEVFYSIVSVWEIAIKHAINPLNMPISEEEFVYLCDTVGFLRLDIQPEHIYTIKTLHRDEAEKKHNDPFDRLLISQAKANNIIFVTHDELLSGYKEKCVMKV